MEMTAALVREQGVVFAVVLVQPHVLNSQTQSNDLFQSLRTIRDFQQIPIAFAAQSGNRVLYRGRNDIVNFLKSVPFTALPWRKYRIS